MKSLNVLFIFSFILCAGMKTLNAQNVAIPDTNFKAVLLGDTTINTNGDAEIQVTEAMAYTGRITCSGQNIGDLTGIEAFVNLTELNCFGNQLISLDLSQNDSLVFLYCQSNQLSSLDVKNGNNLNFTTFNATNNPNLSCIQVDDSLYSTTNWTSIDPTSVFSANCSVVITVNIPNANFKANLVANSALNTNNDGEIQVVEAMAYTGSIDISNQSISDLTGLEAFVNLTELNCLGNNLTSLDVTPNTGLTNLNCDYNQISTLDVTQNTNLSVLLCRQNQLTSLDVTQNVNLTILECQYNQISTLDVTQNTNLADLFCQFNQLTTLDMTQNIGLIYFQCSNNQLSSVNVLQNTSMIVFRCTDNQISTLDVSQNINLIELDCSFNQISSVDVTQNTSLASLKCSDNQISNLDVTQNISLVTLFCQSNQLSALDMSPNVNLTNLFCQSNQLSTLNVQNGNNTNMLTFLAMNNPNLTCIQVDDAAYATANWTGIDGTTSFSTNCSVFNNINTINSNINLSAYPSPTTEAITLDFGKVYQEAKIQVTNLAGQTVLSKSIQNNSTTMLDLEGAAGIYFINIETEEGRSSLKVIKE